VSYFQRATESGREPIVMVELLLDQCSLVYGNAPCTAAIGVTGSTQCFNTRQTCQDPSNYARSTVLYRFYTPQAKVPTNIGTGALIALPFLQAAPEITETVLDPAGGLGIRGAVTCRFTDHQHHDRGIDPYVATRAENATSDPFDRGTFFGKFLARNPFYLGRELRVIYAFMDGDEVDFTNAITLRYVIETVTGPTNEVVTVTAKDVIKLADTDRAQAPRPSRGALINAITAEPSFQVEGAASEYPAAPFKVRIGDEIMRVGTASHDGTATWSFSNVARGIDGTTLENHSEDATVQLVLEYAGETVADILENLLQSFANVPTTFIPKASWDAQQPDIGYLFSAQISEPTGVKDLIESLCAASGTFIWYHTRLQQIELKALVPTPALNTLPLIDGGRDVVKDSLAVRRRDDKRLSQVWYTYGLLNSTDDIEGDFSNYASTLVSINTDAESADQYGQPKKRDIWARWTPPAARAAAEVIGTRIRSRYEIAPLEAKFSVDVKSGNLWTGDLFVLKIRGIQDDLGNDALVPFQIIESRQRRDSIQYTALEYRVLPVDDVVEIVISQDAENVNLRNVYELTVGSVGTDPIEVNVRVTSGTVVYGNPAITGGGFPSGSLIKITNNGSIIGNAGNGGAGGSAVNEPGLQQANDGQAGGNGGLAVNLTEDWELTNNGLIAGGSGGGGGGGGSIEGTDAYGGGGGGGGQFILPGVKGLGGTGGFAQATGSANAGQNGQPGSATAGGAGGGAFVTGGPGGAGADYATAGASGSPGSSLTGVNGSGGAGGTPGAAVEKNGNTLTEIETGTIIGAVNP